MLFDASKLHAVVEAAHVFRGAKAAGCLAYALENVPAELKFVADKVTAGGPDSPALLHATLAPRARMSSSDYVAAFSSWRAEAAPCMLAGAGACGGGGDCGSGCGTDGVRAPQRDADTEATLGKAALRLAAVAAAGDERLPAGGSPGM